jgi:AcrR family transcriptional regulator
MPPRRPTAAASTAARSPLSRERIAQVGLELLEHEGLEALSMRRLADELGVGTMTLYGYVDGKEDLLDAVIDHGAAEFGLPPARGSWREQLSELAHALHRVLVARPHLARLRLTRPIVTPGAFRFTERGMQALGEAGFDRAEAAQAFRCLFVWVFGSASFNAETRAEDARRESRAAIARLPPGEYPAVTAAIDELPATLSGEEQFAYGLERLLDGFEARLAER